MLAADGFRGTKCSVLVMAKWGFARGSEEKAGSSNMGGGGMVDGLSGGGGA